MLAYEILSNHLEQVMIEDISPGLSLVACEVGLFHCLVDLLLGYLAQQGFHHLRIKQDS